MLIMISIQSTSRRDFSGVSHTTLSAESPGSERVWPPWCWPDCHYLVCRPPKESVCLAGEEREEGTSSLPVSLLLLSQSGLWRFRVIRKCWDYVYHLAWLLCQLSYHAGGGDSLHIINMVNVNHYNYADTAAQQCQTRPAYHGDLHVYHPDLQRPFTMLIFTDPMRR